MMNLRRYLFVMSLICISLATATCSTLSFHGEGSIDSNPPPSPAMPSSPNPAEEPGVEPHADPGQVSGPKNVILELIDP